MWLLPNHRLFRPSLVFLLVAISGITCAQPTVFPMLKTSKAIAAIAFVTCKNFEMGFKLNEFSGIMVSASANQDLTKAPFSFKGLNMNSRCSCHRRRPFSEAEHLPAHCTTHTKSFYWSPLGQLLLPVH